MKISIEEMKEYFSKDGPYYAIILYYDEFNSNEFKKINFLQKTLIESNFKVLRLSKLSINNYMNSLFLDMHQKAMRVDNKDLVILVDSFLPILHDFNIDCSEYIRFFSKLDDKDSKINKQNIKLILGLTYNQKLKIPAQANMLRRFKMGREINLNEVGEELFDENREEIYQINNQHLPTLNMNSVWSNNPLYYLINKQNKEYAIADNYNDAVINMVNKFSSINLINFATIFRQVVMETFNKNDIINIFNNPDKKENSRKIQYFNISQVIKYLIALKDIFEIQIENEILDKILIESD